MGSFNLDLRRVHAKYDGDPVEVWIAEVEAEAYGQGRGKTPGEALRHLADEFDVQFGAMPRGNWKDIDADVNLYTGDL